MRYANLFGYVKKNSYICNMKKSKEEIKEIAYNLMVMLGDIQNTYRRGEEEEEPVTADEVDEMYGLASELNEYLSEE